LGLLHAAFRMLALLAACESALVAWVVWCGAQSTQIQFLEQAVTWSERLHLPAHVARTRAFLALADLQPDRQPTLLASAFRNDPRNAKLLERLAVEAEFSGDPPQAERLLDQLTQAHRAYRSFVLAAGQAARAQNLRRRDRFAALALTYCPRQSDEIFMLYSDWQQLAPILQAHSLERRIDYLRFLIGANRLREGLYFQVSLPSHPTADQLRLTLSERFLLARDFTNAAALFERVHESWRGDTLFNANFAIQPSGIGFDWRLSQDPAVRADWRPGVLELQLTNLATPLELLSMYHRSRPPDPAIPNPTIPRPSPIWHGDVRGLEWRVEPVADGAHRISLWATAGPPRQFTLRELRLQ
jgi:hypothetical protein